jgi:heme-degrading monooxygenase HmoA
MKYLKKFNESSSYDFPNAEEAVKKIDYFISQMSDYEYDLVRKEGFDLDYSNNISYFFRVYPNDLPLGVSDSIRKSIPARIELTIHTNNESRDKLKSLYKDLEFLPHALKMEGLYTEMEYIKSKEVGNDYIVFTIFDTEKELELWEEKSRFSKNWNEVKKRQENS